MSCLENGLLTYDSSCSKYGSYLTVVAWGLLILSTKRSIYLYLRTYLYLIIEFRIRRQIVSIFKQTLSKICRSILHCWIVFTFQPVLALSICSWTFSSLKNLNNSRYYSCTVTQFCTFNLEKLWCFFFTQIISPSKSFHFHLE